jgi:hypothetical protein
MDKRGILIFTLTALLISILSFSFASASYLNVCSSGCDYTIIQSAINDASDGDTINVSAEIYNENITINKANIVLQSVNGAENTIIDANGRNATIVYIISNNVTFDGFTIQNANGINEYGIWLNGMNESTIKNSVIKNIKGYSYAFGLQMINANNNIISNITISDLNMTRLSVVNLGAFGIWTTSSDNNTFTDITINNIISRSDAQGIMLYKGSDGNSFSRTIISALATNGNGNSVFPVGITIYSGTSPCNNNIFTNTNISNLRATGISGWSAGIQVRGDSLANTGNLFINTNISDIASTGYVFGVAITTGSSVIFDGGSIQNLSGTTSARGVNIWQEVSPNSSANISNMKISINAGTGVRIVAGVNTNLSNINFCDLSGNTIAGVRTTSMDILNATRNWWGSAVEETIQSNIVGNVSFIPYYLDEGMTTLFVPAGIIWYNQTDGFSIPSIAGSGISTPVGITSNGSDIWVVDVTGFVNHFDSSLTNLTDGFSTSISGCTAPRGLFFNGTQLISINDVDDKLCVMNLDGSSAGGDDADLPTIFAGESYGSWVAGVGGNESDLWISESQSGARLFHLLPDYTDGGVIDIGTLAGLHSPYGSVFNGTDFYVTATIPPIWEFRIYHLDLQGNLYENFSVAGFGDDTPTDLAFYQTADIMNSPITDLWVTNQNGGFVYHITNTFVDSPPIINSIAIAPSTAYHTDTLNCSAIYSDVDGDKGNVSIYWYNGSDLFSSITRLDVSDASMVSDVLPTGIQVGGEIWNCTVNATDNWGLSGIASSITIQISHPIVVSVDVPTIIPINPKVADDLNCSTTAYINPIYALKVNLTLIKNGDIIQTWTKDTTNGSLVSQSLGSYQIGDNITCQAIAYMNSSNSSTEEASAIIQQADYIINITNCMNITGSGTYQFTGNLPYNGIITPCINITVDDVIIDGQGFEILGSTITNSAFGLKTGDNWRNNITIKNVNLSGYPSVAGWDTGFLTGKASNCSFINNTVRATVGIGDWNGGSGAILQSSLIEGNRFYSSTANSPIGIWLQNESSNNNIIRNNYFNIAGASTGVCVYANTYSGNNNYINNIMFCQTEALYFDTCRYNGNKVIGNEMTCTLETHGCLDLEGCQFNTIAGNKISGGLYAIGFQTFSGFISSNNLFYDNQILSGTYSLKMLHTGYGIGYQNLTFLNTTGIGNIFEGFGTDPHEINVGWYVKITVRNNLGVLIGGASVSIYNRTGDLVVSGITQSNGNFSANLTEYTYYIDYLPKNYHSLYNISITSNGYYDNSTELNVSGNKQVEIFMSNIPIIIRSGIMPCPLNDMFCNALTGLGIGTGNLLMNTTRAVTPLAIAIPIIIAVIIFVVMFIKLFPQVQRNEKISL